ncbi:MAG: hypothetical protein ABDH20_03420 [Thermus sp.]
MKGKVAFFTEKLLSYMLPREHRENVSKALMGKEFAFPGDYSGKEWLESRPWANLPEAKLADLTVREASRAGYQYLFCLAAERAGKRAFWEEALATASYALGLAKALSLVSEKAEALIEEMGRTNETENQEGRNGERGEGSRGNPGQAGESG